MRPHPEGQWIKETEGVVRAADIEAVLRPGGGGGEPKPAPLALTPEQARLKMSGQYVGDGPPGWEASSVDGETAARVMGVRADDFDTMPLGSMKEGVPVKVGERMKIEPRPERTPGDAASAKRPLTPAEADELRTYYRAHVEKVTSLAQSAKESGDPAREARAAEQVRESAALGERLRGLLGGTL